MNLQNADIEELKNSYELHQCDWAKRCLDNIEKEMKQLQTKANKYDAIKNKMKDAIEEINADKLNYSEDEWYLESDMKAYAIDKIKELLEEEEV